MFKLMKLILYRIIHNKANLITYLVLIPIVLAMAIYITNSVSFQLQIGVVNDIEVVACEGVQYTYLKERPANSQMVLSEYDAVVIQEGETVEVLSTKGVEYNRLIASLVTGQIDSMPDTGMHRGNATQIIGFLMMVVSLLGVQIYEYYFDERKGINKRILGSDIHCYEYIFSYFMVVLSFVFIPALLVLCSIISIFHIVLSIALWEFVFVLFLLSLFASSFGIWVSTVFNTFEESMMFGNMVAIIGTILAGGFVEVTQNKIFNAFVEMLPQRQIMLLLSALENHLALPVLGIVYIVGLSLAMLVMAMIVEKKKISVR